MYLNKKNLVSIFTVLSFLVFVVGFFAVTKNISALTCPGLNPAVNYGMICSSASIACSPNAGSLSCGGAVCGTPYYNYANQCVAKCSCTDVNQGGNSFSNASCGYDSSGNGVCNYNFDGPYCTIDFGVGSMELPSSGCVSQSAAESCIYNTSGPQVGVQCGGSGNCYGFKSCQSNNFYGACDFSMTNGNSCTTDGGVTVGKCNIGTCIPIVTGKCGPSNGSSLYTAPVGGLCSSGSVSSISGTGPWSWLCIGSGGGSNDQCSASLKQDASCGDAAKNYTSTNTAYSGVYCFTGTLNGGTPVFPAPGSSSSWSCSGINGGSSSGTCIASRATAADFSISASAYPTTIVGGSASSITVTLTPINGFNSSVNVTAPAGVTPGTATISGGSGTAVFTYQSVASDSGTKSFTFNAASGSLSHSTSTNVVVNPAPPTVSLTADANSVSYNGSTNLRWTSSYATSCSASGAWSGAQPVSGGPISTGQLTSSKTYTITCTGPGGSSGPSSVTITVGAPPVVTVSLSASPNPINYNTSATLSWNVQNATSCSASGSSGAWSGSRSYTSGSETTGNLLSDKTYTLTCIGDGSPSGVSASVIVAVNAPPAVFVGLTANPSSVAYNGYSSISWNVQNATACTASANMPTGNWTTGGSTNNVSTASLISNQIYSLSCTGPGTPASASVNVSVGVINGSCGSVNGTISTTIPSTNLCSTSFGSTPSTPSYNGNTWTWTCNGSLNGGSPSPTCSVTAQASCGSSSGGNFQSVPTNNLCSIGSNSSPVQNGTSWNWICSNGASNKNCYANVMVPGSCGTANSKTYTYGTTGYGTDTQCNTGTPSNTSFPTAGNNTTWTCSGTNGGSVSGTCSASQAPAPIAGQCGTSNSANFYTAPTTNLCNTTGSAPTVSGSGPWTWTCTGQNGGSNASCSANKNADGICGSAANPSLSQPTTNLCATSYGNTTISGSGPWSWDCNPLNNGVKASCVALKQIVGTCGTANKTYPNTATSFGSDTLCSAGTVNPANPSFPVFNSSSPWQCMGINGGADSSCQASMGPAPIAGQCGTSNSANFYTAPTTNLCNTTGSAPTVSGSGPWTWTWTCTGQNGGSNASCSANKSVDPVCGTASTNYPYTATAFSGTYCSQGNVLSIPAFPSPGGSTVWSCQGVNTPNTISCPATVTATPIPGSCGTANSKTYTYGTTGYGTDTQCNTGTPSNTSFPTAGNNTTWTCSGTNGGSVSGTCSASQAPAPIAGQCNPLTNGQSFYSAPTANLCLYGNSSSIPSGSGPWVWTCNGLNNGSSSFCFALQKVDGICGPANGQSFYSAPTTNLCVTTYGNSPSYLSGSGPWTWTCNGLDGGASSPVCLANQSVTASCGSAATSYSFSATSFSGSFCGQGVLHNGVTPAFPAQGSSSNWTCDGLNGGNSSGTCTATRGLAPVAGQCGSADNGSNSATIPTSNLCATSFGNTPLVNTGTSWTWTCNGSNGGPSSDTCVTNKTINASCGPAAYNYAYYDTSYNGAYCLLGYPNSTPAFPSPGSSSAWTCLGLNGGSDTSCVASVSPGPVDGICGSAAKSYPYTDTNYTGSFCSSGTANSTPSFPSPGGTSSWTCMGSNGGNSNICIASVEYQPNGVCGTAARNYSVSETGWGSDTFCSAGYPSVTPAFPPVNFVSSWYCIGSATASTFCSASRGGSSPPTSTGSNEGTACGVPVNFFNCTCGGQCDVAYCNAPDNFSQGVCSCIHYECAPPPQPPVSVTFNANPTTVTYGGSTVLTWSSVNATSCTGSGGSNGWSGSKAVVNGMQTISGLTSSATFNLTCQGNTGSVSQSVYVNVLSANYIVNVIKTIGGSVKSSDGNIVCGDVCSHLYSTGDNISLVAYPDSANWKFVGWTNDCSGNGNCALNINGIKTIKAIFVPSPSVYKEF